MPKSFRTEILELFEQKKFSRGRGGVFVESSEIIIIIDPNTSVKTGGFSLSSGIWIKFLGEKGPENYYKCHIYGGVIDLLPRLNLTFRSNEIYSKGKNNHNFLCYLTESVSIQVFSLLTLNFVKAAFLRGDFKRCLIRKEAREILQMGVVGDPS